MRTTLNNVVVLNTFAGSNGESREHTKWSKFIGYLNSKHRAGFGGGCFNEHYGLVNDVASVTSDVPTGAEVISLDEALDIINFIEYLGNNKSFFVERPTIVGFDWEQYIITLNSMPHTNFDGDQENAYYGILNGSGSCLGIQGFNRANTRCIPLDEGIRLLELLTKYREQVENQIVTTYNGDELRLIDCVMLGDGSEHDGAYARATDTVHSRPHACHILTSEASRDARGNWFNADFADDMDYFYSDFNEEWICTNWNDVHYGYTSSSRHEEYFMSDDYVYAGNSYYANRDVAMEHGYYYDNDCDEWYHEDDDRPSRVQNYNSGYHSGRGRGWKAGDSPKFTIGVEVEKEDDEAGLIHWQGVYGRTGWIKESDGSLDENGYELVSPIFDLYTDDMDKEINGDNELKELIDADYSDNCGGHINIGSSMYTPTQIFEGLSAFMPLMYSMYTNRLTKSYCQAKRKHQYHSQDKYASVYIKDQVVEFRIFPAVRSVKNLLWRRDFVRIMCDNINKSELDVLKMLVNQNSKLYKHMRKIFSQDELLEKAKLFIYYSERFNDKKLPPIDPKKLKKGGDNITDSTEDLGA